MPGKSPSLIETTAENTESKDNVQTVYDHMADIEYAQKVLLSRRHFSVRNQIFLGNILVFLFALIMILVLTLNNNQVEQRLKFLEFVNDFSSEIQQARRYEKNYFLYGTNLNEALENIHLAEAIFIKESEEFSELLGGQWARQEIFAKIGAYKTLLEQLYRGEQSQVGFHASEVSKETQLKLRGYGKEILSSAYTMISLEKKTLAKSLSRSRQIHICSIIGLLIFLAINTYLLVSRLYSTLDRFANYAKRIASGDFRPILPRRKIRDEFTDLAVAINEMIKEIDLREAVLIQTHKMKAIGTLTAGVAHEINNPLNNIMLTAHVLIEDYHDLTDDEIMEMLEDVVAETDRSKKIIRNLLDFARESTSTMEPVDLSGLLKDTVHLLENQIRFSGIQVDLKFADNLPKIHGDVQKIQQVFVNLILNALDASTRGNKIQIVGSLGNTGEDIKVSVIDYGQGIPKHILPSIFDPFFTTKAKGKGTGLGLSVSQGIIAKHGGTITAQSEEGSGSCFTIVFPIINFPEIHTFSL
jgi:two-component system, NtrC family, sensor kinase